MFWQIIPVRLQGKIHFFIPFFLYNRIDLCPEVNLKVLNEFLYSFFLAYTVLSGDFSPGLQHHPFLSIQHPQYKFCDLHSILSHWEVQFQSIHMLPRIPHQESKTSLNFSLIYPWQFFMNFFLFLFNKWLPLHLNICLYVQKKCGADSEWMRGPPGSCNQDPSLWPQM